ncbi:MAG: PIN domain-containing protein [Anaerolineae bacterium]|nr:PIN domain-containing protein [Anaerolineae bacterium]
MIAVADTSYMLAFMNIDDKWHKSCQQLFKTHQTIYLPQSTLSEIGYMLGKSGGNKRVAHFLRYLPEVEKFKVETLTTPDMLRTADLLDKYADSRVDFVDATVAAIAERLNVTRILTLDQRDFQILRPRHTDRFELLP